MNNKLILYSALGSLTLLILVMAGCPVYGVFTARMEGKALLAHATYSKEVAVATAKAKMESAVYEAQADTILAHGIAQSNQIIGNSLKENEPYLYFKWLQTLQEMKGEGQVIYLPGGAFPNMELPITEASRIQKKSLAASDKPNPCSCDKYQNNKHE